MTPETKPLDLSAIEAREKAATPGEWKWMCVSLPGIGRGRADVAWLLHDGRTNDDGYAAGTIVLRHQAATWVPVQSDRDFVANARSDVPALVAEVRRLRAELRVESDRVASASDEYDRLVETIHETFPNWCTDDGEDDTLNADEKIEEAGRIVERFEKVKSRAETAEKRVAELEAAARTALVVIAGTHEGLAARANGSHDNCESWCSLAQTRNHLSSLLAKGGA